MLCINEALIFIGTGLAVLVFAQEVRHIPDAILRAGRINVVERHFFRFAIQEVNSGQRAARAHEVTQVVIFFAVDVGAERAGTFGIVKIGQ